MEDLQRITGFSRDQLRDRLGYLEGTLGHDFTRGPRNAIIVGDATAAALDRMKELERGGLGPQIAADQIAQELKKPDGNEPQIGPRMRPGEVEMPSPALIEALERHIKSLEDRINGLEGDKGVLRGRVRELETLALPAVSEGRRRLSRLEHLKAFFVGQ